MTERKFTNAASSLSARARPQYHYFYGSIEDGADKIKEETNELDESLFGEELVPTDHEEETPPNSREDLQHLLVTNQPAPKTPASEQLNSNIAITLLIIILATIFLLVLPRAEEPMTAEGVVPYPHIDRADFGDPVEGFISMDLFHPTLLSETKPRSFVFPFPTGAFWTNLVMKSSEEKISYPIVVYPYAYKWAESSLLLSYPFAHRSIKERLIQHQFAPDLTISMAETAQNRYVTKFDPLSVTLRFVSSPKSKWETTLVQGSPYTTIKSLNATPTFTPLSTFKSVQCPGDDTEKFSDIIDNDLDGGRRLFGVCSIDESNKKKTTMRGVQFIFKTSEGLSWILFSSEPMNLEFDAIGKALIKSVGPFDGIMRLAYIPATDPALNKTADDSTGLRRLIYHAGVYPTGGQVSWDFHTPLASTVSSTNQDEDIQSRYATVTFNYATQTMIDASHMSYDSAKPLLMLALPHHADVLNKRVLLKPEKFDLVFHTIKGPLTPVLGSSWSYDEPMTDIGFDGPLQDIPPSVRQKLFEQIDEDLDQVLPSSAENIYGFSKQVARLAQLTHIVTKIQRSEDESQTGMTLMEKAVALLSNYLETFLSSQVVDRLYFDANLGGLVSSNGLFDPNEDFGNGRYNDHHFHYGYLLYACAVMGNLDPVFVERFGPNVDAIFRDVAHPLSGNSQEIEPGDNLFFPLTRHKSWFDGHSFATGLFPFATGKSQESSSEAANCYYGAYLWSLVRHGQNTKSELTDFAKLLLAMEIRSTKAYWHMIPTSASNKTDTKEVYEPAFQENYMVGNLGMLDVTATTWFGNDPLYVHLINVLPVTAATGLLFENDYVKYEYPYLMESRGSVEMAWRGYTVALQAILDPNKAWTDAQDLKSYQLDSALSKSQVLYWISQRPTFNVSSVAINYADEKANTNYGDVDESVLCSSHPTCTQVGLSGSCCPANNNVMLDCCT